MSSSYRYTLCSAPTPSSVIQASVTLPRQEMIMARPAGDVRTYLIMCGHLQREKSMLSKRKVRRSQRICRQEIICSVPSFSFVNISHIWHYSSDFQYHLWRKEKISQNLSHNIMKYFIFHNISQLKKQIKKPNISLKGQN